MGAWSQNRTCENPNPSPTYSLPQSNLAVMCCLTSLMRSWVRWPTSTCLLRSRISFITCQSRWNKSPSFFCGSGRRWFRDERGREKKHRESVKGGVGGVGGWKRNWREGKTEWGCQTERETEIRRWKYTVASECNRKRIKSTLRARRRSEERSQTAEQRFVQISLSALLLFAINVCSTICPLPSSEFN